MPLLRPLLAGLAFASLALPAQAELWRWTDASGVIRYTANATRVPAAAKHTLARVEPGLAAAAPVAAAPAPAAKAPELLIPADEFSFSADPFNAPDQARTLRGDEVPEPLETSETPAPPEAPPAVSTKPPEPPAPVLPPTPAPNTSAVPEANAPSSPTPPRAAAPSPQPAAARVAPKPPATPAQRERRAELAAQIARDEARLKTLISSEATRAGEPTDEMRAIAARLPKLQAELQELEAGTPGGDDPADP